MCKSKLQVKCMEEKMVVQKKRFDCFDVYISAECTSQQKLDTNSKKFYIENRLSAQCYRLFEASLFGFLDYIRYFAIVKPA